MIRRISNKLLHWSARFLQLQLFISLISLPILSSWGLPFSLLSPLGNVLFTPFVTLFLLLSSLIFFCELLCIPNGLLINCLELLYSCWISLLKWIPFNPLIGFPKSSILFISGVSFITFLLLCLNRLRSIKNVYRSIACMSTLFLLSWCYAYYCHKQLHSELPCNRGTITIIYDNKTVAVIDPGLIGTTQSAYSWIAYTLFPHIISTTGKTSIDYLILLQPNKTVLNALCDVIKEFSINTIVIPERKQEYNNSPNIYRNLKEAAKEVGTPIITIDNQTRKIRFGQTVLSLVPESTWIKNSSFSIRAVKLDGTSPGKSFSCKPHKITNKQRKKRTSSHYNDSSINGH